MPAAVTGVVGPESLAAVFSTFPAAPTAVSAPAEVVPGVFTADAAALVGFSRSLVETSSEVGGPGELNVASAGLQRPAPGWLMAPLESLRESSPYGLRRSPLTGQSGEFHWGQDYGAACGTRVYSADAGVVRAVGWHPWGGGNRVEIDHGNGLITTYNHLEGIAVKKGDSVRVSEVIARVGTTGSSTGCHLHFETILNGAHTDPHGWKMLPTTQVDPLGPISMISFEPEADKASNAAIGWAIPVRTDRTHEVTGGDEETPVAAAPVPASTTRPVPGITAPGTSTPGTTAPGTSTPGTTTPGTTAPGTSTPGTTTPGTSTPGTSTPGTAAPGTSTPGTCGPGYVDAGDLSAGHAVVNFDAIAQRVPCYSCPASRHPNPERGNADQTGRAVDHASRAVDHAGRAADQTSRAGQTRNPHEQHPATEEVPGGSSGTHDADRIARICIGNLCGGNRYAPSHQEAEGLNAGRRTAGTGLKRELRPSRLARALLRPP